MIVSTHSFEAIGTHWAIVVHHDLVVPTTIWQEIEDWITNFDQQFSRFILTSEANAWRQAKPGTYAVSTGLAQLLQFGAELRQKTQGKFDPAVGGLLEQAGYDANYSFIPQPNAKDWQIPDWQITGTQLTISGPLVIDVGGYGKGSCIDGAAAILKKHDYNHFLVDGGGDLFGTHKADGSGWNIGIEWPGKPEYALSQITLINQALAVSDIFKRSWGEWHHVLDPQTGRPYSKIWGISTLAKTAELADGLTTALSFLNPPERIALAAEYHAEYLLLTAENMVEQSQSWPGEIYLDSESA